jgi:multiple sugar transport system substrate-binding protein
VSATAPVIELRGVTWDHDRGYAPLAASTRRYASEFAVRIQWDKRSLKDFGDAPPGALAERYDLLVIDHPHVGVAAETGCLLPLDSWIAPDVLATLARESAGPSHASYSYAGHQWALAVDAAMQTSAYRPDLLCAQLPSSWEEAASLAAPLALPLQPTDAICSFLTLCASFAHPAACGDRLVDDAIGHRALRTLADLRARAHPSSLDWNPILLLDHMSRSNDVSYCPLAFCYTNYSRAGYAPQLVRFATIPGVGGSILGGAGLAVSARCAHAEAACAYAAWICSATIQRTLYVENGGQPGNVAAWKDDAANRLTSSFFRDTLPTLESAWVRPRDRWWPAFQDEAGHVVHAFLRDSGRRTDGEIVGCLSKLEDRFARAQARA